jgi:two-component system, chemotaxis family, sensor kinase CheA
MEKLQEIFMAEAAELINDLERALLSFESDLTDLRNVQEIFRVMHSLKGSASMFGFEAVSALTHNLETIYDSIREGKVTADRAILDVTLKSVDHLKQIMTDPTLSGKRNREVHAEMLQTIETLVQTSAGAHSGQHTVTSQEKKGSYYIYFKPSVGLFRNGTNPLYLVDDIVALGKSFVIPRLDEVPELESLVADECHASFEIFLDTTARIDDIRDVFIFIDDASIVQINLLPGTDLLSDDAFLSVIQSMSSPAGRPIGLDGVNHILRASGTPVKAGSALSSQPRSEAASIRVSSEKLDELMNLVSELVTSQARLNLISEQYGGAELANLSENIEKITRRLRDNAFNICLVPIETLVIRFQRLVRDLAKDLGKDILFVAEGTETELDRSIIEKVTEPILHIIRNCIDHGIESPEDRIKHGKKRQGNIQLKAYHSGTSVFIQIRDDGGGIDLERVRQKASQKGLVATDSVLDEKSALDLLFLPGFSTAEQVTDISGRGVGLDVVRKNIESIHGEVVLETKRGQGTTFTIKLPLTLSIMDGMLVRIGNSKYILPLSSIDKCFEMETTKISADVCQKHVFDGALLPVFNLHSVFTENVNHSTMTQVIRLNYDEYPVCVTVDNIIGEYQAVLKPLGDLYQGQDEFSGATILGDGSVALVVDTDKLIHQLINNTIKMKN